ncbi:MAG: LURP-one-related/scramblase family protein [Oscillospiraceae bacterium]
MRMLFKQRFFSWFDSYDIYDENGGTLYNVEGKLAWGHKLEIHDTAGTLLGSVKERVLTFLPKFELYVGNEYVGEIRKELTFLRPSYALDFHGWHVQGDLFGWDYRVTDAGNRIVASVSKELLNFTDTYTIDVADPGNALWALMIVLAIDAANCSQND